MPEQPDESSLAAQLAYEFWGKQRAGQQPDFASYLARLPEDQYGEFEQLVSLAETLGRFVNTEATLELSKSLSELPTDGPDIVQE